MLERGSNALPLGQVRLLMVSRMAKPEEVLVVENDQGEVVREFMKDTDSINLYKNMRETLGNLFMYRVLNTVTKIRTTTEKRVITNKKKRKA